MVNCFKRLINILNSAVGEVARVNIANANIWLPLGVITWKWYATLFRKGETASFCVLNYEEILIYGVSAYNTYSMYQFRLRCYAGLNCRNRYPLRQERAVRNEFPSIDFRPRRSKEASTFSHVYRFAAVWAIARALRLVTALRNW